MALKIRLNEQRLDEMAQIGVIGSKYIVRVWTNDPGHIPHIHIIDSDTNGRKLDACVRLDKSAYFKHGAHTDTLNASQRKMLDAFMREELKDDYFPNNYEYAVYEWNRNNSGTRVMLERDSNNRIVVPDYKYISDK